MHCVCTMLIKLCWAFNTCKHHRSNRERSAAFAAAKSSPQLVDTSMAVAGRAEVDDKPHPQIVVHPHSTDAGISVVGVEGQDNGCIHRIAE